MALIVETGLIVPGADTYASVDDLRAYAAKRGASLPADDAECEVLLIKAMDYLASKAERWKGHRVQLDQPLDWPRYGVTITGYGGANVGGFGFGFELPLDEIPDDIKRGQMQLAIDVQTVDLQPIQDAASQRGPVTNETVDVISVSYAGPAVNRSVTWFMKADGFLAKFYGAGMNQVRMIRG